MEPFSPYEKTIVKDSEFLLAKREIIRKVSDLFSVLSTELEDKIGTNFFSRIFTDYKPQHPKITKGESYRGLPFAALDFGGVFSRADVFTLRTFFGWGYGYTCNIIASDRFLEPAKTFLLPKALTIKDARIATGEEIWDYYFEDDNSEAAKGGQNKLPAGYLRFGIKIPLNAEFSEVMEQAVRFYSAVTLSTNALSAR